MRVVAKNSGLRGSELACEFQVSFPDLVPIYSARFLIILTMSIDKTWMGILNRALPQYEIGVREFLDFAFKNLDEPQYHFDADMANATSTRDSSSTLNEEADDPISGSPTNPNEEAAKFYRLLQELQQVLYPGCEESSILTFIC
ncbi:hypothetical protein COLO4_24428 [Corchorus olitorius]|uniref:Uncharacterized protein n=1 Tax=Corchorus olitorius TaxID=93759 RepID=A0A1R3IAC2_9ROSI|nr:hypothetical protein COLO4_24428 [Corchorus olitorius]